MSACGTVISESQRPNFSLYCYYLLKEWSRPSVSNVTSADVRLATPVARDQFCDVIGSRHEFHLKLRTDWAPKLFNETNETDPLNLKAILCFNWSLHCTVVFASKDNFS